MPAHAPVTAADRRARLPRGLVRVSLRHPRALLLLWLAVLVGSVAGVVRVRIETSTDSVLDRTSPEWATYQESLALFGADEILVIALEGDSPFDPAALAEVERLTPRLEAIDGVRRVDSLSTVPIVEGSPDGTLHLDAALDAGVPASEAERQRLARRVRADRIAPRSLVSEDGRVVAINVLLEESFAGGIESVVRAIEAELPPGGAWISGVPIVRTGINTRTGAEIRFFIGLTLVVIGVLLFAAFRSLVAVLLPLAVGGTGTMVLLAAMGVVGTPITLTTMIVPSVVLALGCAYVMHLLTAAAGLRGEADLLDAFAPVALPVALSGLTTTLGFLAIAAIRIDAIRAVGLYGALGVLVSLMATLSVGPAVLRLWPLPPAPPAIARGIDRALRPRLLGLARGWPGAVLGAWLLATLGAGLGLSFLRVETDATRWFPPGSDIRDDYEAIKRMLSGISPMNVMVESTGGREVTRVEALSRIDALSTYLGSLPGVGKSISVADPLRQLNGGFLDSAEAPLPDSFELAQQYLLLLESVEQLDDLITDDRLVANVLLRVDDNGSDHLTALADEVRAWWQEHGAAGYRVRPTGIMYEFARAADEIAFGQIRGLSIALVFVAGILFAIFRRPPVVGVAMLPNLLPLAIAFGVMGWIGEPLDAGTALVGSLALGMAVDDTMHLVSGFDELTEQGAGAGEALERTLERVLAPLTYTTVAVAAGFAVLGFSQFTFTRNLGLLTTGVVLLCFLADAVLLPVLLLRLGRREAPAGPSPL